MRKAEELFLAIGGLEAARLEQTEEQTGTQRKPKSRFLLIAAILAMTILLVGCAVSVYAKIRMQYVQHETPTATVPKETNAAVETPNVLTDCYPQRVPAGYTMISGAPLDRTSRNISYRKEDGTELYFLISTGHSPDFTVEGEKTESQCNISGWTATAWRTAEEQCIWWHNETEGYYAGLYTKDLTVDLESVGQSVAFGQRLPLAFLCKAGEPWDIWYPQWVPEGFTMADVTIGSGIVSVKYRGSEGSIQYVASFVEEFDTSEPPHDSFVWTEETVGGAQAKMMTISSGQRLLFWQNGQEGFNAMLLVSDTTVDILAVAESVAPGATLELSQNYLGADYSIELEQDQGTYTGWAPIYPQWIPEGYAVTFVSEPCYGEQLIHYENASGGSFVYHFLYRLGKYGRDFGGTGEPEPVDINGNTGYLDKGSLVWTDEAKGYAFLLAGDEDLDLAAIARSVAPGPELTPTYQAQTDKALEELGDYRITDLPEGVTLEELTGRPLADGGGWYSYVRQWYFNKKTNQQIYFTYETYDFGSEPFTVEALIRNSFGSESSVEYRTVCGCPGGWGQDGQATVVVWVRENGQKGVKFYLSSEDYTGETLLIMAESVQQ